MANRVLVDTDNLIDSARSIPEAVSALAKNEKSSILCISIVTEYELIVGCRDKRELQKLERFLSRFELVRFDAQISDRAADLLRAYRLSHGLLTADSMVAATAIVHDIPLLAKNQRDYRFIPGLSLLPYP